MGARRAGRLPIDVIVYPRTGEYAASAALLADVGTLVAYAGNAAAWDAIERASCVDPRPRHLLERDALGVSHAEVSAYLLGTWGLPDPIVEAVAHHHDPGAAAEPGFGVVGVTHVACALASGGEPDQPYLEAVGCAERLEGWRDLTLELAA